MDSVEIDFYSFFPFETVLDNGFNRYKGIILNVSNVKSFIESEIIFLLGS